MKKIWFDMVVNALSLIVFMLMVSTGLILKLTLPPGSGRLEKVLYGGSGASRLISTYMGLSRHEWGEVHFWVAVIFFALLIFHLCLHWNWIKCIAWGTKQLPQSLQRKTLTLGIMIFLIFAFLFPLIGKKETFTREEYWNKHKSQINSGTGR